MTDEKVSKEVHDLNMAHLRQSLHEIRNSLAATALLSKTVTENVIKLEELKDDHKKTERVTDKNQRDIVVLNTHKKYLSIIGASAVGLIVAWIKTKL